MPAYDQAQQMSETGPSKPCSSRMEQAGRSFGSRFKEKVNVGYSKNMDYSDSHSQ